MTAASLATGMEAGLRPLDGKILWGYRAVWCLFAFGALATVALSAVEWGAPALVVVRLLKALIIGSAAAILLVRRPRDPVAAILALAFLSWIITSSHDFSSASGLPALLDRLRFLLFVLALLLFPDGRWTPVWTRQVVVASAIVFAVGIGESTGLIASQVFLPAAILCVIAAIVSLVQRHRSATDQVQEQQLKWVALGLVTGVGSILTARAGAAASIGVQGAMAFELLFQIGIVLVGLGFVVPLIRYRLYDADRFISRSAALAGLTAGLVATFAGSEALIEALGQQFLGSGAASASGAIAAAVAAMLLTPLHNRISAWAEARFQADLLQLRIDLPELLWDMPADWSQEEVGTAAIRRIAEAVHASRTVLVLDGKRIAALGSDAGQWDDQSTFPVRLSLRCPFGRVHGWLCLGPRPDGSLHGSDEKAALHEILVPLRRRLTVAISDSEDRRAQKAFRREQFHTLKSIKTRLDRLESAISANC